MKMNRKIQTTVFVVLMAVLTLTGCGRTARSFSDAIGRMSRIVDRAGGK